MYILVYSWAMLKVKGMGGRVLLTDYTAKEGKCPQSAVLAQLSVCVVSVHWFPKHVVSRPFPAGYCGWLGWSALTKMMCL